MSCFLEMKVAKNSKTNMAEVKNTNSVLFLYEGDTEAEFYKRVFDIYVPSRSIRITRANLNGVYSLEGKVENKIKSYLVNPSFRDCENIHVIIAYDREGERHVNPLLDLKSLKKQFLTKKARIKTINQVVATQDLESWFFHDMSGIYAYLRASKKQRIHTVYPNVEKAHNRILSDLFHKHDKHYQKGKRAEGFIEALNLEKIVDSVSELQELILILRGLNKGD